MREMLIPILIVVNIPVYFFIGWLAFDSKDNAADTFFDTIIAVLKMIFIPGILRVLLGMDTSGSWGLFPIGCYLAACAGVVYGEYVLIGKVFGIA
jgi:threonine/homoserine efflux transporter RhtA